MLKYVLGKMKEKKMITDEEKLKELKMALMMTYRLRGSPFQRKNIRKSVARIKTKQNENRS